jgi:hypothetical protein
MQEEIYNYWGGGGIFLSFTTKVQGETTDPRMGTATCQNSQDSCLVTEIYQVVVLDGKVTK